MLEQAPGEGTRLQRRHRRRARGLAGYRDVVGIAAELRDVALDPLQRRDLIEETVVARRMMRRFGRQLRMGEEAQGADPVVEVDEDDAFPGEVFASVHRHPARAEREAAAVDVDDHRQFCPRRRGPARPDVEGEAILTRRLLAEIMIDVVAPEHLDAFRRLAVGVVDALPGRDRLWLAPAQVTHRRRREGDAEIGAHAAVEQLSRDRAAVDGDRVVGDRPFHNLGGGSGSGKRPRDGESERDAYGGEEDALRYPQMTARPSDARLGHSTASLDVALAHAALSS